MQKLQMILIKSKSLKILVAFALCLLLVFNSFSVALMPVKALALETAILYVLASLCFSMSISIAVDPIYWGSTFQPLYDSLSSGCQAWLDEAARGVGLGFAYVFEWTPQQYSQLTSEILAYFESASAASAYGLVTPSSSDGKIGFLDGYSFTISYPQTSSCSYLFPSSEMIVYDRYDSNSDAYYPYTSGKNRGYRIISDIGLGYHSFTYYGSSGHYYNTTFSSYRYTSGSAPCLRNNSLYIYILDIPTSKNSMYPNSSEYNLFFDSDGTYYTYYQSGSVWKLQDLNNSSHFYQYNGSDLAFSNLRDLVCWFLNRCGFVTNVTGTSVDSYVAPTADTGFNYDSDISADIRSENVASADAAGSISTVIPSSTAEVEALNEDPAVVLDPAAASSVVGIYPSDLPVIDKSPVLWQTKFPFCIPFDFARILGDLQAPPEAPELSFIILPENFFDLGNEAYYVDIDFSLFSEFIAILRFFLSLGFVLFLILITREIIKG